MDGMREDGARIEGRVPGDEEAGAAWPALLALRAAADAGRAPPQPCPPPTSPLAGLFLPLLAPPSAADGCTVVGRLAQTLDGRIATVTGSSQWIGGRGDILHTHRLRALCHAVLVGAATVRGDDPRLTTREVEGPDPVRVVLDTDRRLATDHAVFRRPGPPTLLVCAEDAPGPETHGHAACCGWRARRRGRASPSRPSCWRCGRGGCRGSSSRAGASRSAASSPRAAWTGCT
jgi:hypothetical protein